MYTAARLSCNVLSFGQSLRLAISVIKHSKRRTKGMSSKFCRGMYSMFHVRWITFKFNRNQLGTVSAYVSHVTMAITALLMYTLK